MSINVGETHATVESGGKTSSAVIIERKCNATGGITEVLLDRVIHSSYWRDDEWEADGAFATVLTRKRGAGAYVSPDAEMEPGAGDSPGLVALSKHLGDDALALNVAASVRAAAPDDWRGNLVKRRVVMRAIADVLDDEDKVEACYQIVEAHEEF